MYIDALNNNLKPKIYKYFNFVHVLLTCNLYLATWNFLVVKVVHYNYTTFFTYDLRLYTYD